MKSRWIVIAALMAVALVFFTAVAVYRSGDSNEPQAPRPAPKPTENAPAQEPDPPKAAFVPQPTQPSSPRPLPQPESLPSEVPAPRPVAPEDEKRPPVAPKRPIILRITGTVEDAQGRSLENAQLRWIPLEFSQIRQTSYDSILVDGEASRLPAEDPLRDALMRSRATRSDPQGRFEFEFDRIERPMGVVAATAQGYEIEIKRIEVPFNGRRSAEEMVRQGLETVMDFRLGFAAVISGTIRDRSSGAGVADMAVAAQKHQSGTFSMRRFEERSQADLTDAEGRYAIRGLPPGEYWIAPKTGHSDYVSVSFRKGRKVTLEAGSEIDQLDFEVERGGRIWGRFSDPDGEPLAGVRHSLAPSHLTALLMSGKADEYTEIVTQPKQITPKDGSFEFRGLRLGLSYRVQGDAAGLANIVSEPLQLTEESPQAELELVMSRGSAISGSVLQPDGQAAPKSLVMAYPQGSNPLDLATRGAFEPAQSDAEGSFKLEHLSAGKYLLTAGTSMNFTSLLAMRGKEQDPRFTTVEVDGRRDLSGIVLTLDESEKSRVSGIVTDDLGQPIERAVVTATDLAAAVPASSSGVSAPDGTFTMQIEGKGPFRLEARSGNSRTTLSGVEAGSTDLHIVLNRPGSVAGRVIAPDGASLPPGSRIESRPFSEGDPQAALRRSFGPASAFAAPEVDGSFHIEAPAGQVEIVARVPGFAPARSSPVAVRPGMETADVDILLTEGAVLLGTVVQEDGTPLEGAEVRALLDEDELTTQLSRSGPYGWMIATNVTSSDMEGRFEFSHLHPGSYLVSARYGDRVPSESVEIALDEGQTQRVRLEIVLGGSIDGLIVEGDLPRPGLGVLASSETSLAKSAASDEEGRFVLEGLAAGEYGLHVVDLQAGGQRILKSLQVTVREGQAKQVAIDLASGQRIFGSLQGGSAENRYQIVLRRAGSQPLQGLSPLQFAQALMMSAGSIQTQSPGEYEMPSIDPGQYLLQVYRLPKDPFLTSYQTLEQTPLFQQQMVVGNQDVRVDIVIR